MQDNILTHNLIRTDNLTTLAWDQGSRSRRPTQGHDIVMTDAGFQQVLASLNLAHMNSYAVDSLVNSI